MKHLLVRLLVCVGLSVLSARGSLMLFEDFESYNNGLTDNDIRNTNPGSVGAVWQNSATASQRYEAGEVTVTVLGGNQVLRVVQSNNTGETGYRSLGAQAIADSSTAATLFFRLQWSGLASGLGTWFGLADVAAPNTSFTDYEAYVGITTNDIEINARNDSAVQKIADVPDDLPADTWGYFWMVVDNSTDTYDIYFNTTGADATAGDLIADDFAFRGGGAEANTLQTLGFMSNDPQGGTVYLDDIYIDSSGADLSNPLLPVPEPASVFLLLGGLGALAMRRRRA